VKKVVLFSLLLLLGGLLPGQDSGGGTECLLLRGGNLAVSPGKVLEKTDLLIQDGLIVEIGKNLHAPWDAKVLDCRGMWIYPGFVHIASRTGLRTAGNPNLDPAAVLSADPATWKRFLKAGFTTVGIMGRGRGMTGKVAVIRPWGRNREEMIRIRCAAVAFGAGGDGVTARSVVKILQAGKKELERRKKEAEAKAKAAAAGKKKAASKPASRPSGKGGKKKKEEEGKKPSPKPKSSAGNPPKKPARPAPSRKRPSKARPPAMILLAAEVMEGKIPAFVEVAGPTGFLYLQKALGDLRPPMLLFADRPPRSEPPLSILASRLKALGASVVVPVGLAQVPFERALTNPALEFERAGVEFLLQPGEGSSLGDFRLRLIRLAKYGLKPASVLAAITTRPARWLGMADRIGTLEKGKIADLVLFSGKFLDVEARLLRVLIEGRTVYEFKK